MNSRCINIYLPATVDTSAFPDDLYGEFEEHQDYKVESTWMFYLMLRNEGLDVRIVHEFPEEGILLIHKALVKQYVWRPNLFIVSMQWDYKRDDRAQMHLVSNEHKTRSLSLSWLDRVSGAGLQFFVPPPMHPSLIPRDPGRGDRFENVAFIGAEKNLEPDFRGPDFRQKVEALDMRFVVVDDPDKMADYSEIDAVLAVRKLGRLIVHKPAQKLFNAWRAGVPAILGREWGYQELWQSDVDYIEVDSADEVIEALQCIKTDVKFRRNMISNARTKAEGLTPEAIQRKWADLFRDKAIPAYHAWKSKSAWSRNLFLVVRWMRHISRQVLSFVWHRVFGVKARS